MPSWHSTGTRPASGSSSELGSRSGRPRSTKHYRALLAHDFAGYRAPGTALPEPS